MVKKKSGLICTSCSFDSSRCDVMGIDAAATVNSSVRQERGDLEFCGSGVVEILGVF